MYAAYVQNDPSASVYCCPLTDGAGTAASETISFSGSATASGANTIYVNNISISAAVASGDSATAQAAAYAAAVNTEASNPNTILSVTASASGGNVTLTSAHKGVSAGDLQVSINKNGETTPSGVSVSVGSFIAGTVDPDLTTLISNISAVAWSFLVCPYTTTTVNSQIQSLLSDTTGRWSPINQLYGFCFNAVRGTLATLTTYGSSVGSNKHVSTLGVLDSQTPLYVAAAAYAGMVANTVRSNPALPIVGILEGVDAPSILYRLRRTDENTLLYAGITPPRVDSSGNFKVARAVQNYQSDTNYLNLETDFLVEYVDRTIRTDLETTFAQMSLVADGNPTGPDATTPKLVLKHVWGIYLALEQDGIVQNSKDFIAQSYCDADLTAGVVSLYLPTQVADQLRIIRIQNSFR